MRLFSMALTGLMVAGLASAGTVFSDNFESGTLGNWTTTSSNPAPVVVGSPVHGGNFAARLGTTTGAEPLGDSAMFHLLTALPAGATLDFWVESETTDIIDFDWTDAYIQNSSGGLLQTLYHTDVIQAYTHLTFDLSTYAGQDIRIAFLTHQDGFGDLTVQHIDDLTVTTQDVPEPFSASLCLIGLGAFGTLTMLRRRCVRS